VPYPDYNPIVADTKNPESSGSPPATAGAIGQQSASKYIRTIVSQPVPPEAQALALAREKTIEVSASDADVLIETNPAMTKADLAPPAPPAREARAGGSQEPTDPGVLQRQRTLRRRIAVAAVGGLGLVAIAMVSRGAVHRASASATPSPRPEPPAASAVAVASSSTPAPAPSAAEANAAPADSATAQPDVPAASSSAKTPAPKTHPGRPRHPPTKVVR
jgi:hypothetical protein